MNEDVRNSGADQDRFTAGVRDLQGQSESDDGKFYEIEREEDHFRRDPEESRHNEGGQRVRTEGDAEFEKLADTSPEGRKISTTKPQTSL
jgi:hypothetical protein